MDQVIQIMLICYIIHLRLLVNSHAIIAMGYMFSETVKLNSKFLIIAITCNLLLSPSLLINDVTH